MNTKKYSRKINKLYVDLWVIVVFFFLCDLFLYTFLYFSKVVLILQL